MKMYNLSKQKLKFQKTYWILLQIFRKLVRAVRVAVKDYRHLPYLFMGLGARVLKTSVPIAS